MNSGEETVRHLLDLCKRAENIGKRMFSAFLTPAEQDDFRHCPGAAGYEWSFEGGFDAAERRILAAGSGLPGEEEAEAPISVVLVQPQSEKFAEDLGHRDFLGAVLNLGIERSTVGDIVVRDGKAWIVCLDHVRDLLLDDLTRVRRTAVRTSLCERDVPDLQPRLVPMHVNVASERLDAVVAEFAGISRAQAPALFTAGKVFLDGREATDRSVRLRPGSVFSVRGYGKARYDGVVRETKKGRLLVCIQKYG